MDSIGDKNFDEAVSFNIYSVLETLNPYFAKLCFLVFSILEFKILAFKSKFIN